MDPLENPLEIFRERLPHRPYCTDDLSTGLLIRKRKEALQRRYIQHSPPVLLCWLVFDIDRAGGVLAWEDANVAVPNITIRTPHNQHGQVAYGILDPVCTSDVARQSPLRLAAAIQRAYTERLGADPSYNGVIMKNPFHPAWATEHLAWSLYELSELADWVELNWYKPKPLNVDWQEWGLGRNCTLFDRLGPQGKWAYHEIRRYWGSPRRVWDERVLDKALEWNSAFANPLPYNEVRYLARSVARFTWREFTPAQFQAIQSERGKRSGQARAQTMLAVTPEAKRGQDAARKRVKRHNQGENQLTRAEYLAHAEQRRIEARIRYAKGESLREIAQALGVSHEAVRKMLNS